MATVAVDDGEVNLRVFSFSFNMETADPFKDSPPAEIDAVLSGCMPTDCDVYVVGLQECTGNNFLDVLNSHLAKCGCVLLDNKNFKKAKIAGRGDGAMIQKKTTRICVWVKSAIKKDCCLQCMVPYSFGKKEGSKGAVGMCIRLFDTTMACISCHLSAASLSNRVDQYRKVVDNLGNALGNKYFQLNSQFHHILWMGDMNYRLTGVELPAAVKMLKEGDFKKLHDTHDELALELGRGNIFVDYQEARKNFDGGFCPSYKKDVNRECEDHTDPDWVEKTYLVDFKQQWYKGGRTKVRIPGWCDRMLVHSLASRRGTFTPERATDTADNYNAVNETMLTSDHSPVYCYYGLKVKKMPSLPPSVYKMHLRDVEMLDEDGKHIPVKHVKTLAPAPYEVTDRVSDCKKLSIADVGAGTAGKEIQFVGMNSELHTMGGSHHFLLKFTCGGAKDMKGECTVCIQLSDFMNCKLLTFKEGLSRQGLMLQLNGKNVYAQFTLELQKPAQKGPGTPSRRRSTEGSVPEPE